ncbi:MAG: hypothetical protein NWE76_06795, partial [Candidatus Bathyarchaeota archaeon]|nr:hypothetical protein [Candidatus Bathyarchaeota archaeon]
VVHVYRDKVYILLFDQVRGLVIRYGVSDADSERSTRPYLKGGDIAKQREGSAKEQYDGC